MKTKHVFWGILFISLGLLILADRFMNFEFTFSGVWKLWPIVLILWGIAIIVKKPAARMIISALTALLLGFALFATAKSGYLVLDKGIYFTMDDDDTTSYSYQGNTFTEPFNADYTHISLQVDAGAGYYSIKDTTSELFSAKTEGKNNRYNLNKTATDSMLELEFEMKRTRFTFHNGKMRNRAYISLNTKPVYDLDFDIGAASIDFDLSPYKVEKLRVEMGAASMNIKLGDRADETHFDIDAGASSIKILVPDSAGCEITTDASLSSKNFEGFTKFGDDIYRTENFDSAVKKIYISIDGGVSSIHIARYPQEEW